ncbi:ferredoxin [Streptomyces hirsutus]
MLLKTPHPPADLIEAAEEAADYCPVSAIQLEILPE